MLERCLAHRAFGRQVDVTGACCGAGAFRRGSSRRSCAARSRAAAAALRADRRSRGAEGKIPPAGRDPVSRRPIRIRRQKRALGETAVSRQAAFGRRQHRLRDVPRPREGLLRRPRRRRSACPAARSRAIRRRCGISPGRRPCSGTAARAAWRSRSRGRSSRRTRWRSRWRRWSRGLPPTSDYARAFAKAFPDDPRVERRQPEKGDRDLRAHAGVAADALRPLDRGRRRGARRAGDRRLPSVHRQGRLRQLPLAAGRSPTTRSTTSACRARIAAAARCCGWRPPSTPSRRRRCARSAAARPTCTTARSRRSPTSCGTMRAASSSGRRCRRILRRGNSADRTSRPRSSPSSAR